MLPPEGGSLGGTSVYFGVAAIIGAAAGLITAVVAAIKSIRSDNRQEDLLELIIKDRLKEGKEKSDERE